MSAVRDASLFLLLAFLWGTAFVAISAGLEYLPPVLFAGLRYALAGVFVVGFVAISAKNWVPRTRTDWLAIGVSAILVIALYNALLFVGQQSVTSGVAAILIATNPILATGFSRVVLSDERLEVLGLIGLAAGFAGVGLVVAPVPGQIGESDVVASVLILLAAGCVALGSVLLQKLESDISTEGIVAWSCILGALILFMLSAGMPTESLADVEPAREALIAVGYLALFASAVGYVVYFQLLDRLGAIEINLVSYVVPPFAVGFGWLLLGETVTWVTMAGFLLIAIGFGLIKREAISTELLH